MLQGLGPWLGRRLSPERHMIPSRVTLQTVRSVGHIDEIIAVSDEMLKGTESSLCPNGN
jgi:hypothetical protein